MDIFTDVKCSNLTQLRTVMCRIRTNLYIFMYSMQLLRTAVHIPKKIRYKRFRTSEKWSCLEICSLKVKILSLHNDAIYNQTWITIKTRRRTNLIPKPHTVYHNCYSSYQKHPSVLRIDSPRFEAVWTVQLQLVRFYRARGWNTTRFNYCFNDRYEVMYIVHSYETTMLWAELLQPDTRFCERAIYLWDFRFSLRWVWSLESSGM
jgi:hypothetical protein